MVGWREIGIIMIVGIGIIPALTIAIIWEAADLHNKRLSIKILISILSIILGYALALIILGGTQ